MLILGIESSCDETGAAIIKDGRYLLSNVVASQAEIHDRYGGVVPEVASRQQLATIIPVIEMAFDQAECGWENIDAVAATYGPGLAGSLLVGLTVGKAMAMAHNLPFLGVNHLEAHIYANWLRGKIEAASKETEDSDWEYQEGDPIFPSMCLVISGAHSELVLARDHGQYELLGRTRDDAAGEAFDKVARILGLSYPGGPAIQKAAQHAQEELEQQGKSAKAVQRGGANVELLAASFQEAVVDVLAVKTRLAAQEYHVKQVVLAGGVAANVNLRARLERELRPLNIRLKYPAIEYCTDNAAMIASAAFFHLLRGEQHGLNLDVEPGLSLPFSKK